MDAPFDPIERAPRTGAARDMKGGVAAMMDAARVIASEGLTADD